MNITIDVLLNALCLAVYCDTEEAKYLLSEFLKLCTKFKEKYADRMDMDVYVMVEVINDIVNDNADPSQPSEKSRIILKLKKSPLAAKDNSVLENVVQILSEDPAKIRPTRIKALLRKVRQWIVLTKSRQEAQTIMMACNKYDSGDEFNNDVLIGNVLDHARKIAEIHDMSLSSAETVDVVDITNPNSVKRAISVYNEKRVSGLFKCGLKQLNKMLGPDNYGFLRGEFAAFAASSHNYKSYMLMKCARWFCTKSYIAVPLGETPCVVFISLENEIPENTNNMLREAYVDIYREPVPSDMPEDELIQKISEYYGQKNIKLIMYRFEDFGFSDFVKLMSSEKAKGHCVVSVVIDYMTLMRLEGDERDNQAVRLQKLANHFRNYAKRNEVLIVTGLQLNTFADELNSTGRANIVKMYTNYHLSDCKGFVKELDILIFMRIEENQDGIPYLTMSWMKHRDSHRPAKKDQYAAYRFSPVLGLPEDEGTDQDYNVPDIYADSPPTEEERELFGIAKE